MAKRWLKSGTLSLLFAAPVFAVAAYAAADVTFYTQAAEGGLAEVEAGKLAQQKASSAAVREFATQMVTAHTRTNEEMKAVAMKHGLQVPAKPAVADAAKLKVIESLEGERFDAAYVKGQVADHENMLGLLQKEIAIGTDQDAQAFAMKILPDVKMHLEMARKLEHGAAGTPH